MARAKTRDQKSYVLNELHDGSILLDDREIFVNPHFGKDEDKSEYDTDFRMSTTFIKNLRLLLTHDKASLDVPILIHMYNTGGNWGPGIAMYDAIKNCPTYITALIHGEACSMGTIIPLAADRVVLMPSVMWMVHDGTTDINDNMTYKQSQSWGKMEEAQRRLMLKIYVNTCRKGKAFKDKTGKQIERYIKDRLASKEDWFLTAEEAVEFGFAHGILGNTGYETVEQIKVH